MFNKISIIGCGLIGSSILRAVEEKKLASQISAYDKSSKVNEFLKKNFSVEICINISDVVKDSDLVIIASPLSSYKEILLSIQSNLKENVILTDKVKERIEKNKRPLLIFPQGTRVKIDENPPFKKGVGRIYKALNLPCVPVALNTGKIWPKSSFMKYPGDIHISFLEPIMSGKNNEEFVKDIENKIYTEIKKFN